MDEPLQVIATQHAPAAIGPYSQGIKCGGLVFTAGQIALDPVTGKPIVGDVAAQTEQVLRNLDAVLRAAGSSLEHLVKTTIFLQDLGDFSAVNAVYAQHVGDPPPARSTVQVAALPLGMLVEIEAVAVVP